MKKLLILLALLPILTTAQTIAKKEFVSQRIADAISNGKFYMKLSGIISIDDDEDGNKWAAEKGAKDMIGKAAKGLGLGAATAFIPVAKSSDTRQRSRIVDSQGNVSSSGISHTSSRTIGVDAFNMTRTKVTTRSGNSVRTVNHASYNFMGLIETF